MNSEGNESRIGTADSRFPISDSKFRPSLHSRKGSELPLSGLALLALMRAVLDRGKPFRFRARGWSMSPFIQDGDVIQVAPTGQSESRISNVGSRIGTPDSRFRPQPLRIGDVAAFVHPANGRLVVHRVIGYGKGAYLIQGDNIWGLVDGPVPKSNILGRVNSVERRGRVVRLGLGPERFILALLSRTRLLLPLIFIIHSLVRPNGRRQTDLPQAGNSRGP